MQNDTKKPLCIFMIGIPYSGKSTYIANNKWLSSMPIASVDDEVMRLSDNDYTQWAAVIEEAALAADLKIEKLIKRKTSFVIDKTNLAALERQKTLQLLKRAGYQTAAIVFPLPNEQTLQKRMAKRSEKMIPLDVLKRMTNLYRQDLKTLNQEFDAVLKLETMELQVKK